MIEVVIVAVIIFAIVFFLTDELLIAIIAAVTISSVCGTSAPAVPSNLIVKERPAQQQTPPSRTPDDTTEWE